jgi:hypothetical protein
MRILQGFLIFMGILAVLAIAVLIVSYVLALLTPDMRSNMRPVVLSSEAVDSFNKKLADFKKEATAAEAARSQKNLQLTITEEEVNSMIVMALAEGTLPAKEMLVNFNDGYLMVYNAWSFPAAPVKTGLYGSIEIENGKPNFIVRDFFLGKLPLPQSADAGIQNLVNIIIKMNGPMDELRFDIKEITILEGQLKMSGTNRINK